MNSPNSNKILIYESDESERIFLSHTCQGFGMECFLAKDHGEACHILNSEKINVAIINYKLEKVEFGSNILTIITGEPNFEAYIQIIRYNPIAIMLRPLSSSLIKFSLTKATKRIGEKVDWSCQTLNILSFLNETVFKLKSLEASPIHQTSLAEALVQYCVKSCPKSVKSSEVKDADNEYKIVELMGERGTLLCKYFSGCLIHQFKDYLKVNHRDFHDKRPASFLAFTDQLKACDSLLEPLNQYTQMITSELNTLNKIKNNFCTEKCSRSKKDLKFSKGDILFSETDNMINGNFKYCTDQNCIIEDFFSLISKKI
ncbi:MAG: hypothetical protein A2381_02735 [Bdellovibrionales bacterium RIFOXYB1_FULL_37_110]|nr:MAG: hypothetical protein A2181_05115 [Bdellovibrionales bacterium RIFOXYA1_FULL_38_20]OFZ52614.1 MAG: hypothetical protein A2417_01070 [Bdellovibrionales bacterium RIFOXYC1_FULL_37_79]OFZ58304.1 MAG: hypothetical protein A2381_02735 [Bdellovibrionales bacterium RIFOXYB1_FULL_37_110]OFZ65277.1 MAG: hypothetical protein A2577_03980 [Bdellovibrionales bacterium RIFOXYD1_FULL_36_51]